MGTTTNRLGLEKPVITDQFSTQDIADNWQAIDDQTTLFVQNILGNRPAAGTAGRFFADTDDGHISYDDGTRWLRVPSAEPGGQHQFEKGTAAAPGLGFAGDTNTGVASLGADTLNLVTAGRSHWRINGAGEFGGRNFSSATTSAIATAETGNSNARWYARVDGLMGWGPGNATQDVTLYRDAASRLRVNGDFYVNGTAWVDGEIKDTGSGELVAAFDANTVALGLTHNTVRVPIGSEAAPGLAFNSDTDTGFWRRSSAVISWVGNGNEGGYLHQGGVRTKDGTLGGPAYSFINDTNSGMYSGGNGSVRLVANGNTRLDITNSRTSCTSSQFQAPNGSQASPGLQFDDPDTGFYHVTSLNQVGLAIEGVREFLFGQSGSYIDNAYHSTTSSGANVNVTSDGGGDGRLRRVTSLRKFKKDIASLDGAFLAKGRALNPVSFRSKIEGDDDTVQIGLIAEEVAEDFPELAVYEKNELQSVSYDRAGVVALALAQQALDRLDALEAR